MEKWSTHLRCYIPPGRKRFLFVVSLSHNKLLVSRGKHGVSCYCIEDCYNSNFTCVGNGPQTTSRTCDRLRHYGWDVQTTLSTAPTSRPVTSIYLGSFRSTCLTFESQQTITWSKPSSPGYRPLTTITSTPGYKPWCHGGTNVYVSVLNTCMWSLMCTICYLCPIYTSMSE
jgi:hypothetical protein